MPNMLRLSTRGDYSFARWLRREVTSRWLTKHHEHVDAEGHQVWQGVHDGEFRCRKIDDSYQHGVGKQDDVDTGFGQDHGLSRRQPDEQYCRDGKRDGRYQRAVAQVDDSLELARQTGAERSDRFRQEHDGRDEDAGQFDGQGRTAETVVAP